MSKAYSKFFYGGIVTSLISVCFFSRVNLKQIDEKTVIGIRGHAIPEKLEILHGVRAFLVFLNKF